MPGLMSRDQMPPAGRTAAERTPMGAAGEEANASPEEQAAYDAFVTQGMKLVFNPEGLPKLLQAINGNGNPVEGLANAATMIVTRVEDAARDQGMELSGDVKFQGGIELLEHLVELAEAAGVHEFSEEDMESALFLAMDNYRTVREQDGTLPKDDLQQDMAMLQQAEQQGTLEDVLPGIEQFAARAPKPTMEGAA